MHLIIEFQMKKKMTEQKVDRFNIMVGDFNSPLSVSGKTSRQK